MSTNDFGAATTLLRAMQSGDGDLAAQSVHPGRYVEHDPHIPEGAGGLRDYVDSLARSDRKVLRAFRDGDFVFAQSQGDGRVFFDVFRQEDDLVVEHWGFSAEDGPPNRSGHTQADGPTEPRHGQDTEKNKAIVRSYYETVHLAGQHDHVGRYMSGEMQIRHEPGVEDGVTAFERDLAVLTRDRTIDAIKLLLGQGDFVFIAATGTHAGEVCVYVDLYRVEREKLVEHWGFPQPVPPRAEWRNGHGML